MKAVCLALPAMLLLGGCSMLRPEACPSGTQAEWRAELMFGRNIGQRLGVSEGDWHAFTEAEIAPRFPAGFTVSDADGSWRGDDGVIVHEPSKLLIVIAPASTDTRARLDAIAAAYKLRFHQDAVGMLIEPTCASF